MGWLWDLLRRPWIEGLWHRTRFTCCIIATLNRLSSLHHANALRSPELPAQPASAPAVESETQGGKRTAGSVANEEAPTSTLGDGDPDDGVTGAGAAGALVDNDVQRSKLSSEVPADVPDVEVTSQEDGKTARISTSAKDDTGMAKKRCKPDSDTAAADEVRAVACVKWSVNIVASGEGWGGDTWC